MEWIIITGIVALIILIAMIKWVLSIYVKVDQGQALIINRHNSVKVSFNGGIVLPVIHRKEIMDISVKTIEVDRQGANGLICKDNIRADIKVTFFVRVNKTEEDVLKVASTVGVIRASDTRTLEELFQAKFSEALKTVGKQMDFVDLYNERQHFKEAITAVIGKDLNGYSLEDTAIDYVEQTPLDAHNPDNILDAEGRKKIIELTNTQKVKANDNQREADKAIKKQDVEAREAILAMERQQAEAEARQKREIAVVQSREAAEAAKVASEEHLRAETARIATEQEKGILNQNSQREIQVAEKNRERAVAVEEQRVIKERDLEAINRERAVELSRIEKERSLEVERKNIADVVRERVMVDKTVAQEEENIKTLRAAMTAERDKKVALTHAEQQAQEAKIREVLAAQAAEEAATHNAKEKLVLAEAELAAAEKEALAQIRRAEGAQAATAATGLAEAKVKEADAAATEKQGLAKVRVLEAEAGAIAKRGEAEGAATQAKISGEATGLQEKAKAMAALTESTRAHEEFRLTLQRDLDIAKARIAAEVEISERNAHVLGEALGHAKIDIVGGDGAFFDRFVKAVSFGKSMDACADHSRIAGSAAREYLEDGRSLPDDLTKVLTEGKFGPAELKSLASAALLAKIAKADPQKKAELMKKAQELGFGDVISGFLSEG